MSHPSTAKTLWVGNLEYSLTNVDLRSIFSTCGEVARASVIKNVDGAWAGQSSGVAFVTMKTEAAARAAVGALGGKLLLGRTLKVKPAVDNGRGALFSERREYPDKRTCFECGEKDGHLSYTCPRNVLGPVDPPAAPQRKRPRREGAGGGSGRRRGEGNRTADEEEEDPFAREDEESWAAATAAAASGLDGEIPAAAVGKRPRVRAERSGYFSDESD